MSTGYGREGLIQVCAMLLGARHVPERLCGGLMPTWGAITNVHLFTFCSGELTSTNIHDVHTHHQTKASEQLLTSKSPACLVSQFSHFFGSNFSSCKYFLYHLTKKLTITMWTAICCNLDDSSSIRT